MSFKRDGPLVLPRPGEFYQSTSGHDEDTDLPAYSHAASRLHEV